jgi:hypothetical protein
MPLSPLTKTIDLRDGYAGTSERLGTAYPTPGYPILFRDNLSSNQTPFDHHHPPHSPLRLHHPSLSSSRYSFLAKSLIVNLLVQ